MDWKRGVGKTECFMCQERKLREGNDEERWVPRRGGG